MNLPLTYANWNDEQVKQIESHFKESADVLTWAYQTYSSDEIVYACSFGAEGIVLLDLIYKVNKQANIVFLDTGLHFPETYELIDKVKQRYPELQIEMLQPELTLPKQKELYGDKLWEHDPNQCCHLRKILPLSNRLTTVSAWISGLRREQSAQRRKTNYLNKDIRFHTIKICPLIHWTWDEIWSYIMLFQLDYNLLHDHEYPSIGCQPCTLPATDPTDPRSGRWANHNKMECGLHIFR